jgi:hypothetical protein
MTGPSRYIMMTAALLILGAGSALVDSQTESGDIPTRLTAPALAALIDELGGRHVQVVHAKAIAVLNPRAFLIESSSHLGPAGRRWDRVLVLIDKGQLHVSPELIVGQTVHITGVARTVLGIQVTREVPWPEELTRENVRRYQVRAVVLASSVRAPDGVELAKSVPAP